MTKSLLLALVLLGGMAHAQVPTPPVSPQPVATYEYDAQGNPTKRTEAPGVSGFGFVTSGVYDKLERLTSSTDARSGLIQYGYDSRNNPTQLTDPRGLVTTFPRSGYGDPDPLTSPDTGLTDRTFDTAGNLKTSTDSRGAKATYTYDALGRLTTLVYSKSGSTSITYNYYYDEQGAAWSNGVGRLTSIAHPGGTASYKHDPQGRVLSDLQVVNAATGANPTQLSLAVTYSYDGAGNTTSITYPSGRVLDVGYLNGQINALSLKANSGATGVPMLAGITWTPFGAVQEWWWQFTYIPQLHEWKYDTAGRVVQYRIGTSVRQLSYDAANRITTYTHYNRTSGAAQPTLDQSFGYDELGRVTSIVTNSASWSIGYDASGNRTSVTTSGSARSYTTASTSNRLTALTNPAVSFTYDATGNILTGSAGSNAYTATYGLDNRMATLQVGSLSTTYNYDSLGQRFRKYSSSGSASTVIFRYDQQGQLLGEYDSTGTALREYVWLGNIPVAMFTPDPANGANPPLIYYIHADHLGAPRTVRDRAADGLRWRWLAEPFGSTAAENNPAGLGALTMNLRLPGQYFDSESGLHYNYFRDYDSTLGRYVQSDPIGLDGGINTYGYVGGNPLSYKDPAGLDATIWNNTSGGRSRWDGATNGNWGGKCWSGGQYSCGPGRGLGKAPPSDSGDACYQRHDNCYIRCGSNEMCVATCDGTLVDELQRLDNDPRRWPQPPRLGTEGDSRRYRDAAIRYFR
jgi:RHS repeat-associated protein